MRYRLTGRALRSRLVRRLLGPNAYAVLYAADNGLLLVTLEDNTIGRKLGRHGTYAQGALAELFALLTPEARVLVVGAHVGTLLVPLAKRVRAACGIEANPDTFRLLRFNLLINDVTNTTIHNVAAGDSRRTVEFLLNRSNSGGSKLRPADAHFEFVYDHPEVAVVEMAPLDEIVGDEPYDLIVMDIEGAETLALRGMPRTLAACRALQIEFRRDHLAKVAGVTPAEFLGAFRDYFDRAQVAGNPSGRWFRRDEFQALLDGVGDTDLLFVKDTDAPKRTSPGR